MTAATPAAGSAATSPPPMATRGVTALQTGVRFALARGAAYLVTFDADGQLPAEDVAGILTVAVAGALGIAWGADLVSYQPILAMLVGFFLLNVRVRGIESQVTNIVRELALRNPGDRAGADE